ncbi:hypothetical protein EW026_g1129 [Hermanssonia centrifuga]|uniref:Uncharacterized protein n=1 Tax=Hermanssonia centrifuga TaxID=98765 RepID=A0A4S4KSN8_9APHY|nr:hypothetical protein EW026_g1129 [Hermanssonia centrifuga]
MPSYKEGDHVEYRPIGGEQDNVSHSTGTVQKVVEEEDGDVRVTIKNDNTGKATNYMEKNIIRKTD